MGEVIELTSVQKIREFRVRLSGRKALDVQSACSGGIKLIAKFGRGTRRLRLGARSKGASRERSCR